MLGVLLVDEVGQIASIIEDHVEGFATRETGDGLIDAPEVFFLGLTLPREDGDTRGRDAGLKSLFFFFFINDANSRTYAAAAWSWVEKMF